MDMISYSLSKKIAASAVSGVSSMSVDGTTLNIDTNDGQRLQMVFPQPRDGISVTDIDVNANNQIVFTMSDGSEIISGKIPTLKGDAGFSPTITENADNTDKIYKLDVTTADGTFTTPNLKGKDGSGSSTGEENVIESIKVNGVVQTVADDKSVDITVPTVDVDKNYVDTELAKKANTSDIPSLDGYVTETELSAKGYLTEHQDISGKVDKVDGKSLISNTEIERLASVDNYDDTQVKTQIQAVANGLMDSVGYSADYKTIDIIAKNGVKKSVNVAPIISHASITELSDVDTTNKATGKALVYNATTSKHEYADVSGTDEKVKMDASTDAKYLGELLDNVTIANENGELKVKKLDGQEVTITEINYLKGLTMNVMDLVNMFSNGGVKIINTPVATYAELLTLDKSSFIEGISYLVYVLADENHDNAKTTYLVDKDSETPTYFGFADSQRDFTTNPIDLATEITGKLGIANMDSDAIKALFTVDDTYKTETATNNAFSTHGAKALYDELLLAIGNKANSSDLTAHKDDTDIHVSITEKDNWNGKADASDLTAHTDDADIHVTAENKTLWNTVSNKVNKEDGKALLADTDKTNYDDAVTKAHTHENKEVLDGITSDKVTAWDNKSDFSGSYNDLNDKPTIDAELSNTSENAIQNKVVTEEINKLYSDISFNDFDTATDGISFTDAENGNMLVTNATRNLLNPTLETTTQNGVTCTRNVDANGKPDGTYTLNGTATKGVTLYIAGSPVKNTVGGYKLVGCPTNGSNDTYRIVVSYYGNGEWKAEGSDVGNGVIIDGTYPSLNFLIKVESGVTVTNLVFKPMLTTDLDATYDDFVPYSGYEIKTCGKNIVQNTLTNETINGITSVLNPDRSISFNGTASAVAIFAFAPKALKTFWNNCKGDVKLLGCPTDSSGTSSHYLQIWTPNGKTFVDDGKGVVIKESDRAGIPFGNIAIIINAGKTLSDAVFKPMLTTDLNATYDDYEPYVESSVHIDSTTEFPLLGLKSFDGITNIISPANVKCVYPTNESGKGVLDSLYNKDKMLTEQNDSLEVLGKCKNLLNPTLETTTQNGVTCTANGNGTYTLNGTATENVTFHLNVIKMENGTTIKVLGTISGQNAWIGADKFTGGTWKGAINSVGGTNSIGVFDCERLDVYIRLVKGRTANNEILKPMLTTNLSATYDDFVPYTGDGETLTHDVSNIKNDLSPKRIELQNVDERVTIKDNGSFIINGFAFVNLLVTFKETLPQWSNFVRLPRPKNGTMSVYCENSVEFTIYSQDNLPGDCGTYDEVSSGTEVRLLVNYEVA